MKKHEILAVKDLNGNVCAVMIGATGKRAEQINDTRFDDNGYMLSDVYGRCSEQKARAFDYCRKLCYLLRGDSLRVTSHNTFMFTAKFNFINPETGEICIAHITPNHNYFTGASDDYIKQFPYSWNQYATGYVK